MQSELILHPDGSVYHLRLRPGELAPQMLWVGDPARAARIAARFDALEVKRSHREFRSYTGRLGQRRLSVISTGIGTDNIDIVWSEVDALFSLDLSSGAPLPQAQRVQVLRLGTCGGLRPEAAPGTLVFSRYALGGDALMRFYRQPPDLEREALEASFAQFRAGAGLGGLQVYGAAACPAQSALAAADLGIRSGITFTAAGFYGPQGRHLRAQPTWEGLPERLAAFSHEGFAVWNMEMETAGILALGQLLGHSAASLSVVLANRRLGQFAEQPAALEERLIEAGLRLVESWQDA
jgi:uridine phosphorylase